MNSGTKLKFDEATKLMAEQRETIEILSDEGVTQAIRERPEGIKL